MPTMTGKSSKSKRQKQKDAPKSASEDEAENEDTMSADANAAETVVVGTTMEQVKFMLESLLDEKLAKFEENLLAKIDELKENLAATKGIAEKALALARENQQKIDNLTLENAKFQQQITDLRTDKLKVLEESIEDRTNRQLRKTLIFRGVAESPTETWEETEKKLATVMHEVTGDPMSVTTEWIERCHRTGKPSSGKPSDESAGMSSNSGNYTRKGPRVITAGFYDWKDAQHVLTAFMNNTIKNKSSISATQKFGPMTTRRRNAALLERKNLILSKEIKSGYIAYPARLMVKGPNEKVYHLHKDFSRIDIVLP